MKTEIEPGVVVIGAGVVGLSVAIAAQARGKPRRVGVQSHAEHRVVLGGRIAQHVEKGHGAQF